MSNNPFASTVNTDGEKIAGEQDRLGGFQVHDSGVYEAIIKNAYAGKSDGGAASMTYEVELKNGGKYSWTEWVTSGDTKGNLPYWTDKDGNKNYLPGFNRANAIALMTAGKELGGLVFEEKLVKIYNSTAKAEVPTPVKVAVELLNKKILLGILKIKVNKQAKTGEDASGKATYGDTNEVAYKNEVDKVFHAESRRTLQEAQAKLEKGEFIDKWSEANTGKERDKFKAVESRAPGAAVSGAPGANTKPTESLFQ